ncbi:hypothetical protein A2U01_0100855, partial [Trifolium medium]|nr:hypothetical protein [Trifolium medium]
MRRDQKQFRQGCATRATMLLNAQRPGTYPEAAQRAPQG